MNKLGGQVHSGGLKGKTKVEVQNDRDSIARRLDVKKAALAERRVKPS